MSFEDIAVQVEDRIGIVSLARPQHGNSVRPQTMAEICAALDDFASDERVLAIVLRAEGKNFCAGADFAFLSQLSGMSPVDVQRQIYAHFQGAARRVYHCPKPTIALVTGAAVTVGCELALACDFRIAASNARFHESWIRVGLMPPLGGLFLLPRLIGLGRAAQMVLRAEIVHAEAALQMGLVTEVVPQEELEARGRALAVELSRMAPNAYAAIKNALHRGLETSMEAEWSANVVQQVALLATNDFDEGLSAVKERRPPRFTGT